MSTESTFTSRGAAASSAGVLSCSQELALVGSLQVRTQMQTTAPAASLALLGARPASDLAIERVHSSVTPYGFAGQHWTKRNGEGSGALS